MGSTPCPLTSESSSYELVREWTSSEVGIIDIMSPFASSPGSPPGVFGSPREGAEEGFKVWGTLGTVEPDEGD